MGRQVNVKLILIIVGIIIAVAAVGLYFKIQKEDVALHDGVYF